MKVPPDTNEPCGVLSPRPAFRDRAKKRIRAQEGCCADVLNWGYRPALAVGRAVRTQSEKTDALAKFVNLAPGKCHTGNGGGTTKVTFPHKAIETKGIWYGRTSDFRHLGLWHSECDSNGELVITQPDSQTETRKISMRKQKGFSLIELLIVVAIILIIAAIAIPNLLRARIAAN
ncbi:MAG: prepilin-type N-terminal cleavage/methylation domain-containing protein, partial [Terriglobales bacterium]